MKMNNLLIELKLTYTNSSLKKSRLRRVVSMPPSTPTKVVLLAPITFVTASATALNG
jgi:hydroxyacyl-ACP dehydratase HTD2-like protein with hotdog domain